MNHKLSISAGILAIVVIVIYKFNVYKPSVEKRFQTKSNNTILDHETKLLWQRNNIGKMNWYRAKQICKKKFGSSWRLPTIYELMSITSQQKINPALETDKIITKQYDDYWSSTPFHDNKFIWSINLINGIEIWDDKSENHSVLCVKDY